MKLKDEIKIALIKAFADWSVADKSREFGSDMSDITRLHTNKFLSLFKSSIESEIIGKDECRDLDQEDITDVDEIRNILRSEMREKLKKI